MNKPAPMNKLTVHDYKFFKSLLKLELIDFLLIKEDDILSDP